ncbi:hypothetical protein BH11CYA1_BH11CYA1_07650 [soil metagenome]
MLKDSISRLTKLRPEFAAQYENKAPDKYGFNLESFAQWEAFFRFFYDDYYHVKTIGIENIPASGRAILVGNHSGGLPIDAYMTNCANYNLHSHPRRIRCLALDYLLKLPVIKEIITGMGGVPARYSVAKQLLENDELVFFYPEGARGTGKPFKQRYRLIDFDPGFVKAAIATGSSIVPITVVGADEIYPILGRLKGLAHFLGMPYFPLTLGFPWLPLSTSALPLPIKILIVVGKPIHFDYPPERVGDKRLRLRLTKEVQYTIQRQLNYLLRHRRTALTGWDENWLTAFENDFKTK